MAAEKKKMSEKAGSKKASSKVKSAPKSPASYLPVDPANIVVPRGGQVIQFYELTPAFPKKDKKGKLHAQSWMLVPAGSETPVEGNITVGFHENPSKLERKFERAILVIKMKQEAGSDGTWRFALGGVATDLADSDPDNDILTQIVDNGLTMLVFVHVLPEASEENIGFRFVASFADSESGVVEIYESQDPGFIPKRPL